MKKVREAQEGIKPGVERSETPGIRIVKNHEPAEWATALMYQVNIRIQSAIARFRGLQLYLPLILGLTPQALCRRALRALGD